MKYVTAAEAARRCNVSERTVRMWVKDGKLTAHHPQPNRLAIPESQVDAIARERAQYEPVRLDVSGLLERLERIEQRVSALEARISSQQEPQKPVVTDQEAQYYTELINALRRQPQEQETPPSAATYTPPTEPPKRAYTPRERGLPEGAVLARHFAQAHGVNPGTFKDHYSKGIHGERLEISHRPKPGRPHEQEWYVTLEDQERVLDFWRRHNVTFTQ